VHHADARLDRVLRVTKPHGLAMDRDGALVRLLHAVEDLHQRGLARAVLTAHRVDLTGAHGQVHVRIGHHTWESFRDSLQFDRWSGFGHVVKTPHDRRTASSPRRPAICRASGWAERITSTHPDTG